MRISPFFPRKPKPLVLCRSMMLKHDPLPVCFEVIISVMGVLALACGGCSTVSKPDGRSDLMLAFALHESEVDDKVRVRPFVLLVGDGEILAMGEAGWWITVYDDDDPDRIPQVAEAHLPDRIVFGGRNPYYRYVAYRDAPSETLAAYGVAASPTWRGPSIEAATLEEANKIDVNFTLTYYSTALTKPVTRRYEFSDIPLTSREFHLLPFDEGRRLR